MPSRNCTYSEFCNHKVQQRFVVCHRRTRLSACLPRYLSVSVQALNLSWNELRGLGRVGDSPAWLGHLTELDLVGNLLTAVPPALVAATALQQLDMYWQWYGR